MTGWVSGAGPEGNPFSNLLDSVSNKNSIIEEEEVPEAEYLTPNDASGGIQQVHMKVRL